MAYKVLYLSVALFLCLLRSVHVRAQCTPPRSEGNVDLSDSDIIKDSFPEGSQATFKCQSGYIPVTFGASRKVTCTESKWTQLELSCTRKSCGGLSDFPHGRYDIPNGILFGDTVTGVCDKGYQSMTFGTTQRTCRADGWSGREPICEAVKCLSPPAVENSQFKQDSVNDGQFEYGHGVTYVCNSPFTLVGSETLTCSENGQFKPDPPKCVVVSCPTPDVQNGYRTGGKAPPYGSNNFVVYTCSDGYDMKGDSSFKCTENGWTPKPPVCVEYCQRPVFGGHVTISKASASTDKFHDGTNVTFKCESGYKPVNSNSSNIVKCEGKRWTHLELACKGEYCGPPVFGGNVIISKSFDSMSKYLDESNVMFECKSGYEPVDLKASKSVTCVDTQWTNLQLTCKGYCGPPPFEGPFTAKQSNSMNKFPEGFSLEFECKSGYEPVDLKASKSVTCVDTKWTNLQLTCKGDSTSNPSSGPTPGATAGIIVIVCVLLVGVGVGIAYYFKKKNSKREYSHKVVTRNEDL